MNKLSLHKALIINRNQNYRILAPQTLIKEFNHKIILIYHEPKTRLGYLIFKDKNLRDMLTINLFGFLVLYFHIMIDHQEII